jgi:hypothetical protein
MMMMISLNLVNRSLYASLAIQMPLTLIQSSLDLIRPLKIVECFSQNGTALVPRQECATISLLWLLDRLGDCRGKWFNLVALSPTDPFYVFSISALDSIHFTTKAVSTNAIEPVSPSLHHAEPSISALPILFLSTG